ncbi:MAG: hypothetical protein KDJ90_24010 [Nitratireductor sp.]|nr:hypothetical protein [Nitratireductor sp.]
MLKLEKAPGAPTHSLGTFALAMARQRDGSVPKFATLSGIFPWIMHALAWAQRASDRVKSQSGHDYRV